MHALPSYFPSFPCFCLPYYFIFVTFLWFLSFLLPFFWPFYFSVRRNCFWLIGMKHRVSDNTCPLLTTRSATQEPHSCTTHARHGVRALWVGHLFRYVCLHSSSLPAARNTRTCQKKIVNGIFYNVHTSLALMCINCRYTSVTVNVSELKTNRRSQILFFLHVVKCRIRDSSVSIATRYGLDGQGRLPARAQNFSLLHSVQTNSGARPVSYPESKAAGREADHSHPSNSDVKNDGDISPLPHRSSCMLLN
jgi:hypothetical protein